MLISPNAAARSISRLPIPLTGQLRLIDLIARAAPINRRLTAWADDHLDLEGSARRHWVREAGWGTIAGAVIAHHLSDDNRRSEALELVTVPNANLEASPHHVNTG